MDDFGTFNFADDESLLEEFEIMLNQIKEENESKTKPTEDPQCPAIPKEVVESKQECLHPNKVKSHAGGTHFWYCKDCETDWDIV